MSAPSPMSMMASSGRRAASVREALARSAKALTS
jgi:hypothetical protein